MNCKSCKSPCVGTYRQNLNAGNSAWCLEYLRESKEKKVIDMKDYRYHRSHGDGRWKEAAKYRKEAEQSAEDQELQQSADDMWEAMNEDLDKAVSDK